MGDNGEEKYANLEEDRENIRQLQSEYARKRESLDRLQHKQHALNDELGERKKQLEDFLADYQREQLIAGKAKESAANAKSDEAVNEWMRIEVKRMLKDRIPVMNDEAADGDDGKLAIEERKDAQGDDLGGQADKIHDVVLVSYINFQSDGKADDFKVTYRIDKETTVEQLHRDACDYWGCSASKFMLYKVDATDKPESLENRKKEPLQGYPGQPEDQKVLDRSEASHLHLINKEVVQRFKKERTRRKAEEERRRKQENQEEEEQGTLSKLKTLRHGTGRAVAEYQEEHFVEALRQWPGIYSMLKYRNRNAEKLTKKIKFRDVVIYALLAFLSGLSIFYRNHRNDFFMTYGANHMLVHGIEGQTSVPDGRIVNFKSIRQFQDFEAWLAGSFHYQMFNNQSTLRQYFTPCGDMRLRQQQAAQRACPGRKFPTNLQRPCYHVEVHSDTSKKDRLIYAEGIFINMSTPESGRYSWPDPTIWVAADVYDRRQYGYLQRAYDGSGYKVDYSLDPANITASGETFANDLGRFIDVWFTGQTRVVVLDFTLANFDVQGYLAITFVIEISPSGAIKPSYNTSPFHYVPGRNDDIAEVIDVIRTIIIFGYVLCIRVYLETKKEVMRGKNGFSYVFSFCGFLDMSIVALNTSMIIIRGVFDGVPSPHRLNGHYSYTKIAWLESQTSIAEGCLFFIIMVRWTTFTVIVDSINSFFKMFRLSAHMLLSFLAVFIPLFVGQVFFASSIWHPYLSEFSTWTETVITSIKSMRHHDSLSSMYDANQNWTLLYMVYNFFTMTTFLLYGFLAISAYAYFEVELLDAGTLGPSTRSQWLKWMLWGRVYRFLGMSDDGEDDEDRLNEGEEDEEEDEAENRE